MVLDHSCQLFVYPLPAFHLHSPLPLGWPLNSGGWGSSVSPGHSAPAFSYVIVHSHTVPFLLITISPLPSNLLRLSPPSYNLLSSSQMGVVSLSLKFPQHFIGTLRISFILSHLTAIWALDLLPLLNCKLLRREIFSHWIMYQAVHESVVDGWMDGWMSMHLFQYFLREDPYLPGCVWCLYYIESTFVLGSLQRR